MACLLLAAACATGEEQDTSIHPEIDIGAEDAAEAAEPEDPVDVPPDLPADDVADPDAVPDLESDADADPAADDGADPDPDLDPDPDPDPDADPAADPDAEADPDLSDTTGGAGTCADPFVLTGPGVYTADTTGAPSNHDPFCDGWQQSDAEHVWTLTVTSAVTATFHVHPTAHWDPSVYVHHECNVTSSTTLDFCADLWMWEVDENLQADLTAGTWYVFVDAYTSTGPYELTVTY
jgi:hypothetical protein